MPHHKNAQRSRAQLAGRQVRSKAIDFLSDTEDAGHTRSAKLESHFQNAHADESDDDTDSDRDEDEDDLDAPRVAQWIDDDEVLELQEQSEDTSDSEEVDDSHHSEGEAAPSRKLVSTSCAI